MSRIFRSPVRKKTGFYTRSMVNVHGIRSPVAYAGKFRSPVRRPRIMHFMGGGGLGGGLGGGMLFGKKNKKQKKSPTLKVKQARGLRFFGPGNQRKFTKNATLAGSHRSLWRS